MQPIAIRLCCYGLLMLGALVLGPSKTVLAQNRFPSHALTVIIPAPPGGPTDTGARIIAEGLANSLGHPVVPENRPGAGTRVGAAALARSAPDGYTIGAMPNAAMTSPFALGTEVPYTVDDFAPLGIVVFDASVITVKTDSPWKSLKEMIDQAKAQPNKLTYGAAGVGSMGWVAMEVTKLAFGANILFVPYDGTAPVNTAVLGGHIDVGSASLQTTLPLISAGRLRALAITGSKRSKSLPDVPTIAEAANVRPPSFWVGMFAPSKTPKPVLDTLSKSLEGVVKDPAIASQLEGVGLIVDFIGPDAARKLMADEIQTIRKVSSGVSNK